jgi:hypothetical protein
MKLRFSIGLAIALAGPVSDPRHRRQRLDRQGRRVPMAALAGPPVDELGLHSDDADVRDRPTQASAV